MQARCGGRFSRGQVWVLPVLAILGGFACAPEAAPEKPAREERPPAPVGLAAMGAEPAEFLAPFDGTAYRFLVAGHTYGPHDDPAEGLFEPLRLAWREPGATRGALFAILCGDVVVNPHPDRWEELDADLAELGLPVLLAPGNHDTLKKPELPDVVSLRYGRRRLDFRYGPDAFLVGDTARGGGNLAAGDLEALERHLARSPRALFLFLHHLVWVDEEKLARGEVEAGVVNGFVGYASKGNFDEVVLPRMRESNTKCVVFAGDLGAGSAVVQFYEERAENVVLVAGGMGEHAKVGVYHSVVVFSDGIEIEVVWLKGSRREKHWIAF